MNGTKKFPHKLLQDAEPATHFDCTVEARLLGLYNAALLIQMQVLRVSLKDETQGFVFVTDYTSRPDMSPIAATADWTRGIEHEKILKVGVYNAQYKVAQGLRDGDIISIRNMRMKTLARGLVAGRIGTEERLIYKLDPRNTGNEHCIALLG